MELDPEPDSLTCAECGERVTDSGYLPARAGGDETYEPVPDGALCGSCGFNEVGFAGCAPELDDVRDETLAGETADTLLQITVTDDGIDVLSAKD